MLLTAENPDKTADLLSLTPDSPSARNELTTRGFTMSSLLAATVISGSIGTVSVRRQIVDRCDYSETTLLVHDRSPSPAHDEQAVPIQQIVCHVNVALANLGKAKIARLVGVSRPVYYGWLSGEQLNPDNNARMRQLARILAVATEPRRPIHRPFLTDILEGFDRSFTDLLQADTWDEAALIAVATRARQLNDKRDAYLAKLKQPSPEDGKNTLFDNSLALGLEG